MELVTGAMGSLLPKLGELLKQEYGLQKGVKKKIETLSRELGEVYAVLRKIDDVPWDQLDDQVRLWASELREASYDMEDIVDTFRVHVDAPDPATETHKLRCLRKKVSSLFKRSKARRNISNQIQEIYKNLAELAARRDRYKTVNSIVTKPATTIDPRIMNLYKSATELIGIDEPKKRLIDMLSLGDDSGDVPDIKKTKIVSVVGFGGLGKTTLAQAVYDQFRPKFISGCFIPVGRNPDIKKVLRDILIGLDKEKFMDWVNMTMLDEKQLMDELKEFIKEKRCFIVIDDIWDMEAWKLIRCVLQESTSGSRLVITTRISELASYGGEVYKMQPLSHDNSKQLLYTRIADGEGKYFDSPSAEACERILKKCSGVPLAIITIASLLASKPGEDWSEVYNSIGFGHKGNDYVDNTRKILSFSYYDLPSHLKACLLYLSIFPEDQVIEKNSLIWKWVAEGFISEEQSSAARVGLFELGERYFNELINRSMIQPREAKYEGYVDACSVHDMVLDLILHLSSQQNFVSVMNGGERQKPRGSISRRVALQSVKKHNVGQLANIVVDKVRSIFANQCDFCALCPRLPFLRVVEMVGCYVYSKDCRKDDLSEDYLASLLHLRYLTLAGTFEHIPRNVRYLRFLQTLDLQNTVIQELPEELALLTQLVCLRLGCYSETSVPAGLIGKLMSLQELFIRYLDEDVGMQFVKELILLSELRVLKTSIYGRSDESIQSALLESLGHLHNIQELQVSFSSDLDSHYWVVSSDAGWLSCRHLRFLELDYFVFSELPAWINSSHAPNLSYLYMNVVVLKDQDMETLGKLPELSCLILHMESDDDDTKSVVTIKTRNKGVGYFRKLRLLKILGQPIWFDLCGSECNNSRVASSNTIMPSLESLECVIHVRSLNGFDKLLALENLGTSSLRRVTVKVNCEDAGAWEVVGAEAALKHAAAIHPKRPILRSHREPESEMTVVHEAIYKTMRQAPQLADLIGTGQIQILRMPDPTASPSKVMRLLYTDCGYALLALSSNAVHKLWERKYSGESPRGKSSKSVPPVLWQPNNGILMINDTIGGNDPEEATACTALSKNESYLVSASGGKVSLFDMMIFKNMTTFMEPPPAATFLAFYPLDNNVIAIGREDSSIQIYNVRTDEVIKVLMGHQNKVTGLAFSESVELLVSSGADAQLCVWSIYGWEKKKSRYIRLPSNHSSALDGDTMVEFDYNQTQLLVVHESQLAIYDWQLECLCSWFPRDALPAPISNAVYSHGCLSVYAGFRDGAIGIFEAESLTLQCRIAPFSYIPPSISSGETVYPTALATHPCKPNQIAVGMSDGAVLVLQPLDTDDVEVGGNTETEQCPPSDVSNSGGHSQVVDL